jgi:hypothetical protein
MNAKPNSKMAFWAPARSWYRLVERKKYRRAGEAGRIPALVRNRRWHAARQLRAGIPELCLSSYCRDTWTGARWFSTASVEWLPGHRPGSENL